MDLNYRVTAVTAGPRLAAGLPRPLLRLLQHLIDPRLSSREKIDQPRMIPAVAVWCTPSSAPEYRRDCCWSHRYGPIRNSRRRQGRASAMFDRIALKGLTEFIFGFDRTVRPCSPLLIEIENWALVLFAGRRV
jgi:hypothetical protein